MGSGSCKSIQDISLIQRREERGLCDGSENPAIQFVSELFNGGFVR